jgi:subtilisin family serine protease
MKNVLVLVVITVLISLPLADALEIQEKVSTLPDASNLPIVLSFSPPDKKEPWWESTTLDLDRNGVHDSLDEKIEKEEEKKVDVYLDYEFQPSSKDLVILEEKGMEITCVLPIAKSIGLRDVPLHMISSLAALDGVVMVEDKGIIKFYSDIATPAVKAKESEEYSPNTVWELGYSGIGSNIAIIDTGIDNGHPSFEGKRVSGVDFTKPETFLTPRDGTYDPDDTNGHGTTCAGIATGTGAPEDAYMGTAPSAKLVDIRIGTTLGVGPGELPYGQDFYDSALRAIEWAIQHKDEQWPGQNEENYGIDILSLSWGIELEEVSSDGSDLYSRLLDTAVEAGIFVVNAAGNDGPDNDGFDGLSASSLAIIVGATDDLDTIIRDDDVIASYSSRGPRKDNSDGNPYDELKPDISAPGTGITNAEYDRYGDGSGNGYGPRGSGTSYATPNVAGIVALMLEAKPDLTPELVGGILHFTAERRGNATFPELDPFWNKDFGFGIVDAYRAVKVAKSIEDVTEIDTNLQCFIMDIAYSMTPKYIAISGIAWSKDGEVEFVEVRMDDGEWKQAGEIANGTWSKWSYVIDISKYPKGNHTFEARAVSDDKYSLHDEEIVFVSEQRAEGELGTNCLPGIAIIILVAGVATYLLLIKVRKSGA